jgi:menaquinone-dependent protoporphyrinogen oxidase
LIDLPQFEITSVASQLCNGNAGPAAALPSTTPTATKPGLRGIIGQFLNGKEDEMDKPVLVAYGTKYGATAEIAEKIGEVLSQAGLTADVVPADRVADLTHYGAVVLGSAVYIGRWRKEAAKFLEASAATLAQVPVWLFSSGPTDEGDPVELTQGWRFPGKLQPVADRIGPRDVALFHGAVDVGKLNFIERWMLKNIGTPTGDFRDWDAIAAWASSIAEELGA